MAFLRGFSTSPYWQSQSHSMLVYHGSAIDPNVWINHFEIILLGRVACCWVALTFATVGFSRHETPTVELLQFNIGFEHPALDQYQLDPDSWRSTTCASLQRQKKNKWDVNVVWLKSIKPPKWSPPKLIKVDCAHRLYQQKVHVMMILHSS